VNDKLFVKFLFVGPAIFFASVEERFLKIIEKK